MTRPRFTHGGRIDTRDHNGYARGSWGDPSVSPVEYAQRRAAAGEATRDDYATLARYWADECLRMIAFVQMQSHAYLPGSFGIEPCSAPGCDGTAHVRTRADDGVTRESVCETCTHYTREAAEENARTFAARTLHFARLAAEDR